VNYLPGLSLKHDPADRCLLSSYNYRCEPPPEPGSLSLLISFKFISVILVFCF
jgi:hypothetical protein